MQTTFPTDFISIETPALIADLDLLEDNLRLMADYFSGRSCRLRPHFKSHKCVELARRQLAADNASGITCAKLSEAEQLAAGGVKDILIANQVVGDSKARRLAELNRAATVRCAVDSAENIRQLAAAARAAGTIIPVLVEVDVGLRRCGVPPGQPALDLARLVADTPGLRFNGLQGYEGHLMGVEHHAERAEKTREALRPLVETRRALEAAGIPVTVVSSGGTATYDVTGHIPGIDEVQCGSYALMDWHYVRIRPEFKIARWILATVISARDNRAVVDVGAKGVGCEFGPALVAGFPEARALTTAEEHIVFDNLPARVGDRLRLLPSHGCTTHNLYRKLWVMRRDVIEGCWALEGAGCLE
jgi:D-serine deaminase-like pyridoxal phosphate-dependent protein